MSELDIRSLSEIRPGDEAGAVRLSREFLTSMYVLVKNGLVFDDNNPVLLNACDRAAAVVNIIREHNDGAAAIQFLPDGVYVNRTLVKLDSGAHERGEYLHTVWRTFGVGEISATAATTGASWLDVIRELKRCIRTGADSDALKDHVAGSVKLSAVDEFVHASSEESDRVRALRAYCMASLVAEDMLAAMRAGNHVRIVDIKRPLQEMISVAERSTDLLMALVHVKRHKRSVADHLVNTATLTICMAQHLDMTRGALTRLALQACLHGVGHAFDVHPSAPDPDAREAAFALQAVCTLLRTSSSPGLYKGRVIAANEVRLWANHETETSDYPYPPSAAARLIAVAHGYDLMTTPTESRPALLPDEAMRVVMAEAGRRYDDTAVRLLVDVLGVYPVGSVVELTTGQIGIPIRASSSDTGWGFPMVKIVREPDGPLTDGPVVDMTEDAGGIRRMKGCVDTEAQGVNTPAFLIG